MRFMVGYIMNDMIIDTRRYKYYRKPISAPEGSDAGSHMPDPGPNVATTRSSLSTIP